MAHDITQYLLAAQSPDAKVRTEAEAIFRKFREENLPQYLLSLSFELSNEGKPIESRRLAGIILKNDLGAKDSVTKEQPVQQWVQIDISVKSQIKNSLLNTLGSTFREASHTAAQVVAEVASIEIPRKEWPELVGSLLANMTRPDGSPSLKQATLEALGYVCEVISDEDLMQDE
ncbi:ARM repeat superfamily protein, partial [Perilla frutescens var. frutescens]